MASRNVGRMALLALAMAAVARADEAPIGRMVGRQVPDFSLIDVRTGKPDSLFRHGALGKKAAILFFEGIDCPNSNAYLPRLAELADAYRDKGVVVFVINSNASESAADAARHAEEYKLRVPVLKDERNVVADQFLVDRTCEALIVDGHARLRYRGAIDDQIGVGVRRAKAGRCYLAEALDAVLAGGEVETTATSVAGCVLERAQANPKASLPRVRPAAPEIVEALKGIEAPVEVGAVTYAADVAPIIREKCQECHRPRQPAPFSLLGYDDARRRSGTIREVVEDRRMPPWHADPRFGDFANDRRLTSRERATFVAWVDQGTPLGNPEDLPAPKAWPEGWGVGEPDVVFRMSEPYIVPAQGVVRYQYFRVSTGFAEDRWIQSIEARPGDPSVVHHIIVYLDDKRPDRRGMGEHLGGYAPGDMPTICPPGTGKRIPAGSDLVFQVHYTPMGKVREDRSSVGFTFAKTPPTRRAITHGIANSRFRIPAGDGNHEVASHFTFREDSHLLSFMPHMHLRGKDFKYTARYPDGTSELLLSVPAYDFAWQSYYRLAGPKAMPKGTTIDCVAHFDNSANNPSNPDPMKPVRWGDQTWEEMMIGYIDYVPDAPIDPKAGGDEKAKVDATTSELRGNLP
jgi:peroxiredoxin